MKPQRIQRRRTKGWRLPANSVCVTRGTRFGNPFRGPRAVELFEEWLTNTEARDPEPAENINGWDRAQLAFYFTTIRLALPALRGKNLACFCKPGETCHGDTLLEAANR